MRGSPLAIVAGFVLLFAVSTGAGYSVGASVNGGDDVVAASSPASEAPASTLPGAGGERAGPTTSTAPPSTVETTTTTEPGPRRPTREDPLRVALAGDSVMAGLAPAMKAALEADGTAEVRFVLTPSILRDPTVRHTWNQQLEQFDPEIIVMFVGTWESEVLRTGDDPASTDPTWRANYEANILDPWLQLITSRGASVLWIGNPAVGNDEANLAFSALNQAYADLPSRWPSVTYVSAQQALGGSNPTFSPVIVLPDGTALRTRQIDGLHLCPDGAALLADAVVDELVAHWKVSAPDGWQDGPWRTDELYPPESCPAP